MKGRIIEAIKLETGRSTDLVTFPFVILLTALWTDSETTVR